MQLRTRRHPAQDLIGARDHSRQLRRTDFRGQDLPLVTAHACAGRPAARACVRPPRWPASTAESRRRPRRVGVAGTQVHARPGATRSRTLIGHFGDAYRQVLVDAADLDASKAERREPARRRSEHHARQGRDAQGPPAAGRTRGARRVSRGRRAHRPERGLAHAIGVRPGLHTEDNRPPPGDVPSAVEI